MEGDTCLPPSIRSGSGSIVGIRLRHDCPQRRAPGVKSLAHLGGSPMFGRRQVMSFPGVLLEVVQLDSVVLVELDQLPVAQADCSAGKPALIAVAASVS